MWKRGGCLQALCLQGDGSRPAGLKSESSHNWGKSIGNCAALAKNGLTLCSQHTSRQKEQRKSQGTDTYPGSSFTDGDGITQPDNREGGQKKPTETNSSLPATSGSHLHLYVAKITCCFADLGTLHSEVVEV